MLGWGEGVPTCVGVASNGGFDGKKRRGAEPEKENRMCTKYGCTVQIQCTYVRLCGLCVVLRCVVK